ncbi:hypothetical protein Taro_017970 [Colocasia esculenta]|uniref:J domain-containing protein n=1 Tax=Colocasia esculenta TaxID=4460 RepID=A0A843UUV9_COLES|nr:hypothetical protein [Colocasia esculenta]
MAENGEGPTIDNVTIALEKKQEEGRRASWSSALSSLFPANRRSQRVSRRQLRRRQPTAAAMAASEENSALFPIFILTIMALPLIPYTIVKLCRAASRKTRSIHCQCSTQPFEPFSILGLEPGVSDSEIKKAYRSLSIQYHPDKNPDPEAHKYFVEFISKAYQALTDPVSRENYEKYGHPDGRQASEYIEIPVRRNDDEPLQKLFLAVRSELNLDLKNIRTEQAKFWKQHPALIKTELSIQAQLTHESAALPSALQSDFKRILSLGMVPSIPFVKKCNGSLVMELELKKLEDTVKSIHEEMFYLRSSNCQRLTKPLTYLLDSSRCHVYIYHRLWQPLT